MEAPPPDILSLRASMLPAHWPDGKKALEMQVPEWLIRLIYRCLEKAPEHRFRDGSWLHEIILLDSFYTPEVAGIVKKSDHRWQTVVTQKDKELQDLKAVIAQQEKELQMERRKVHSDRTPPLSKHKPTGSKAAFNTLLIMLFLVSGLAIYGLFFNNSRLSFGNANNQPLADTNTVSMKNEESNMAISETERTVNKPVAEEKIPPIKDTGTKQKTVTAPTVPTKKVASETDIAKAEETKNKKREEVEDVQTAVKNKNEAEEGVLYKVRNKAYFHNEPDPATRRNAYIVHWNNVLLMPLEERNEFIYIVFTNHLGQVSRGWLSKDDLIEVK
jgi:serine/threonine-protein kinase